MFELTLFCAGDLILHEQQRRGTQEEAAGEVDGDAVRRVAGDAARQVHGDAAGEVDGNVDLDRRRCRLLGQRDFDGGDWQWREVSLLIAPKGRARFHLPPFRSRIPHAEIQELCARQRLPRRKRRNRAFLWG